MRVKRFFGVMILMMGILFIPAFSDAAFTTTENNFEGIVQIYTYNQDSDYNFQFVQSGTGIFLNSNGLILTNEHVVTTRETISKKEKPVGLQICITKDVNSAPDCNYSADILAKDITKDAALLRIKKSKVKDLPLMKGIERVTDTKNLKSGDEIQVWGYPGIGGKTITSTSGSFSGRDTSSQGVKILKTDTTVSFGSSGGAMLNSDGKLVGLVSFISEDNGGTMAYAVDIEELNSWINENEGNLVIKSNFDIEFQDALVEFLKYSVKENPIKFNDADDGFSIIRSNPWDFVYKEENTIKLFPKTAENGAIISASIFVDYIESKYLMNQYELAVKSLFPSCTSLPKVMVSGVLGDHFICLVSGLELNYYFVSVGNRFYSIGFTYGLDDADKEEIDKMLDSIIIDSNALTFTQNSFYSSDRGFVLNPGENWGLKRENYETEVIGGAGKSGNTFLLAIKETSEQKNTMTNDDFYNFIFSDDGTKAVLESLYDKVEVFEPHTDLDLNDHLQDLIRYNYEVTNNGKIIAYSAIYYVRAKDKILQFAFEHYGSDKAEFFAKRAIFEDEILGTLTVENQLTGKPTAELNIIKGEMKGTLIKGESSSAVYLLKEDGKRYVFPNEKIFFSWFENFDDVQTITDQKLASYGLGGNLTFAPGTMIKIPSVPKVFVITYENKMRWIETEAAAKRFFGDDWAKKVKDVGASYFLNYQEIESIK